ncbi:hypothetical protein LCGC14_1912200 [marine sediment metagenome]|uniref:Uncharacterized protein n=1 Tax=marine sediment metagenome TaxID=412755 RepID=A0A0F9IRB2_9ZZZZ
MRKCGRQCRELRRAVREVERGRRKDIQRQALRFHNDSAKWGLEGSLERAIQAQLKILIIELLFHRDIFGSEINLDTIHADDCSPATAKP